MKAQICCISHGRHENVPEFLRKVGSDQVTFFVKDQTDVVNYRANGARKVIASGSLMDSRNAALEHCFEQGKICVQLSDDLVGISFNDFSGKRTKVGVSVVEVLDDLLPNFHVCGSKLGGFPPTDNPYFATKPIEKNKFIVGDFLIVKPNPLRFDTKLRLKEDYDYTLQHIKEYGECVRFGRFLCSFKHYSNKGGAVAYRTDSLEKETIAYLANKWPGCIKMNPKRDNEILISRKAKEVLGQPNLF